MPASYHISQLTCGLPPGFDFIDAVDTGNPAFRQSLMMQGPVITQGAPHLIKVCDVRLDSTDPAQLERWKEMVEASGLARILRCEG